MLNSLQVCKSLFVLILFFQTFFVTAQVNITSSNGGVTITGLSSSANTKLFDSNIQSVWSCNPWQGNPCTSNETVSGLQTGATYFLSTGGQWIPVTIQGGGGGGFCGFEKEYFNMATINSNPRPSQSISGEEVNGNYAFKTRNGTSTNRIDLLTDDEGNQLSVNTQAGDFPSDDYPFLSGSYDIQKVGTNEVKVIVKNANGSTLFNKTYTNFTNQSRSGYNFSVIERSGGYFLYGTWITDSATQNTNLVVARLDNNGNLLNFAEDLYINSPEVPEIIVIDLISSTDFLINMNYGLQSLDLYRVNAQQGIVWNNEILATTYTDSALDIQYDASENSVYAYAFEALNQNLKKINVSNGSTTWKISLVDEINPNSNTIRNFNESRRMVVTSDGGVVVAYVYRDPLGNVFGNEIGKIDKNGNGVWWRRFSYGELNILEPIFEASDGGVVFAGRTAQKFVVYKLNQNGQPTPACGGGCLDTDGDGTCDADDCQPNNPNLPATPGSSCNDFNANTENDEIQSDGCTCEGTPIATGCNVNITSSNGSVTITGLNSSFNTKLFNSSISTVWSCNPWQGNPCSSNETVSGLTAGATYFLSAQSSSCNEWIPITIQGGGGGNGVDLTVANFSSSSGAPGSVVPFTFDLINQGNQTVNQSYNITTYISTDNNLSGNDIQEGNIVTGNTQPGTQSGVNGAITVPSNLSPGNYYLIIKVDDDNNVNETNENNNVRSTNLVVTGNGGGGCNFSNVAPGKSTSQSSTINFAGINAVSSKAIDGNTDGNFYNGSVAATMSEEQAWWQIDLGANHQIQSIEIFNRTEGNSRLNDFYVLISNTPFSGNLINARNQASYERRYTGLAGTPTTWTVNASSGRYVRIQRNFSGHVTLAEVRINGCINTLVPDDNQGFSDAAQPTTTNFSIHKLFPMPVQDELILQLESSIDGEVEVNLSSSTGQIFSNKILPVEEGLNTFSLDCSSVPSGMYHLIIHNKEQVHTEKVVITR